MSDKTIQKPEIHPETDLVLERTVGAPPEKLWRAWTDPKHLVRWFAPKPWVATECQIDLRPGGLFSFAMRGPEGEEVPPTPGCYLEVVENRKLVFTDALGPDYRPNRSPFFTATILFEPCVLEDGKTQGTRYTAIAMHAKPETRKSHEEMGFFEGWGTVLDQLVAYAQEL